MILGFGNSIFEIEILVISWYFRYSGCNWAVVINRNIYKSLNSGKCMVLQDISHNEIGEKPGIALALSDDSIDVNKNKLKALKESIEEIETLIKQREKLSSNIFDDAEKIKIDLGNFIENRDATDEDSMKERNGLRQKQVEMAELQLKEKVSSWQDVARLKQELREKEQELSEKESRMNMLNNIMGDD